VDPRIEFPHGPSRDPTDGNEAPRQRGQAAARRPRTGPARPTGLTLLELTVAVALIAVSLAILLPAVQRARAASRRMTCQNHLKQLALAMHHYHAARSSFPYGFNGGWGHSWSAHLLPYLDRSTLAATIPWSDRGWWGGPDRNSQALRRLARTHQPLFRCPAQSGPLTSDVNQLPGRFVTSYLACAGGDARHDNHGSGGMSTSNGTIRAADFLGETAPPRRLRDIRDGTSHTLLLSEALFQLDAPAGCGTCDRFYLYHPNADSRNGSDFSEALGSTYYPINTRSHREVERECAFSSRHANGVAGGLTDGSVRFFHQSIELSVWRRLGSIADRSIHAPAQWLHAARRSAARNDIIASHRGSSQSGRSISSVRAPIFLQR